VIIQAVRSSRVVLQVRPSVDRVGCGWVLLVCSWPRGYPGRPGSSWQCPWLRCGAGCPLPGCCANQGVGFGNIQVLSVWLTSLAAAVIIQAAMLQMLADLPVRRFGPDSEAARYSRVVLDVSPSVDQEGCW